MVLKLGSVVQDKCFENAKTDDYILPKKSFHVRLPYVDQWDNFNPFHIPTSRNLLLPDPQGKGSMMSNPHIANIQGLMMGEVQLQVNAH